MKKFIAFILTLSILGLAAPLGANPEPLVGEHLSYKVRWFGIPIGTGEIQVQEDEWEGEEVYVITARARANPFLSRFYPVEDELKSIVRKKPFQVLRSEKNLKEGKYRAHEQMDFDYDKGIGYWQSLLSGSKSEIPLADSKHDVLSAFYWCRMQEFSEDHTLNIMLNVDEKNYELQFEVMKRLPLEIRKLGAFESLLVKPLAEFKGVLVDRGEVWIYLTEDARHIPLKIELKTPYGPVLGVLENLPDASV